MKLLLAVSLVASVAQGSAPMLFQPVSNPDGGSFEVRVTGAASGTSWFPDGGIIGFVRQSTGQDGGAWNVTPNEPDVRTTCLNTDPIYGCSFTPTAGYQRVTLTLADSTGYQGSNCYVRAAPYIGSYKQLRLMPLATYPSGSHTPPGQFVDTIDFSTGFPFSGTLEYEVDVSGNYTSLTFLCASTTSGTMSIAWTASRALSRLDNSMVAEGYATTFAAPTLVAGKDSAGLARVPTVTDAGLLLVSVQSQPATTLPLTLPDGGTAGFLGSDDGHLRVEAHSDAVMHAGNSTTTPLSGGGNFTGTTIDMTDYATIRVSVFTDKASATEGFQIQFSNDGTNWDFSRKTTLSANQGAYPAFNRVARYARVNYTNGAQAQTVFRLQTMLIPQSAEYSRVFTDETPGDSTSAVVTSSMIYGLSSAGGGSYVQVKVNPSGSLSVASSPTTATASDTGSCDSVGTSSTNVLSSNSSRKHASICASADNTKKVYIKLGTTATTANFPLVAGQCMSPDNGVSVYTGAIDAISEAGTQSVCAWELQ